MTKDDFKLLNDNQLFKVLCITAPLLIDAFKKFYDKESIETMTSKLRKNDSTGIMKSTCDFLEKTWDVTPLPLQAEFIFLVYLKLEKNINNFCSLMATSANIARLWNSNYNVKLNEMDY